MDPYHHAEFQKKLISQSQENSQMEGKKDRRTEGQKDRQLIHRTLLARAGAPIIIMISKKISLYLKSLKYNFKEI